MQPLPELIQRIYTAVPLVGIGIAATFYFSFLSFAAIATLLVLLIGWEWIYVCGYSHFVPRCSYLLLLLTGCWSIGYCSADWVALLSIAIGVLLIANLVITISEGKQPQYANPFIVLSGSISLILSWYALCTLKHTPIYLAMGLLTVVLTDTLAYIVGKRFGYHRLAPAVSPHKTWEGSLAGLLGPCVIIITVNKLSHYPLYVTTEVAATIIFSSLVAIAGDFFESAIKRKSGLKDSGNSLPGHGGWLDRFDSLIFAMPVFSAGLIYFATV